VSNDWDFARSDAQEVEVLAPSLATLSPTVMDEIIHSWRTP
jgi:hypothetical protein